MTLINIRITRADKVTLSHLKLRLNLARREHDPLKEALAESALNDYLDRLYERLKERKDDRETVLLGG